MKAKEQTMVRSNHLLFKKYFLYLIPSMITYAAFSLNEFVDSMLVANLLDTRAMAIVNIAAPIIFVMSATYSMLGKGGSTIYAIAVGMRDHETAGQSLTAATIAGFIAGAMIFILGTIFITPLVNVMCTVPDMHAEFKPYLQILLLSAPLEVAIMTFVAFLPAAGYPDLCTIVNVVANVVNIFMDYVFIHFFHMGVEGAAWATLVGYICGALVMVITMIRGKTIIHVSKNILQSFRKLFDILRYGSPAAMNQLGLGIQLIVCDRLILASAGAAGMVAYSLCMQGSSVMSIFLSAIIGASEPMLAILHGQRDYQGQASVLKMSMVNQLILTVLGTMIFRIFAPQIAGIYNITDPKELSLSVYAFSVFALVYIPRYAVIVFYTYPKIVGETFYSTLLSALDSFVLLVPTVYIMFKLIGINGIWWGYPLSSIILLVFTVICNLIIAQRSGGRLRGPLLIEHDIEASPIMDVTITKDPSDIAGISMKLQQVCEENGLDKRTAMHAALAVEELALYVSNKKKQSSHIDILVRLSQGNVEIDFRSLGELFNPLMNTEDDIKENIQLLRSISSSIVNDYMMGMNCTRIVLKAKA